MKVFSKLYFWLVRPILCIILQAPLLEEIIVEILFGSISIISKIKEIGASNLLHDFV